MGRQISDKLFTIVVCTYNGEKYLGKCIEALINLHGLENYVEEIKIVDNNSTDNTKKIIEQYAERSNLIRYEFEGRQGLTYAREHAVSSTTPWVIYVDDDNILDTKWLVELSNIVKDESIGVVNGAVIAKPLDTLSTTEDAILHAMYRNLACTHITEPHKTDKNLTPMGAGMCVITKALEKIDRDGWLDLEGRKGEKLSSGEDTELCEKVFAQGYTYHFCPDMKLYHLMPKTRLSEEYSRRLIRGLVTGRVAFLKNQKTKKYKLKLRKIKHAFIFALCNVKMLAFKRNNYKYWENKIKSVQAEEFFELL